MGIKQVNRHGGTLKEKFYLFAIFSGLKTTFKHLFQNLTRHSNVSTLCYPEEQPKDITSRYRGMHRLMKREDGSVRCVACFMCATACPAECIFIEAQERDDGVDEKMPKRFSIDLLECVMCGACVEACPCDAIVMDTGIFSVVGKSRTSFVLEKEALLGLEPFVKEQA